MPEKSDIPWALRPGSAGDHGFVVDSWLTSYRDKARARSCGDLYMREYKWKIREILKRADLLVACDVADPWLILGYAVTSAVGDGGALHGKLLHENEYVRRVHYVFVKELYRREGIARSLLGDLLDEVNVQYSHVSHQAKAPSGWVYNPVADDRLLVERVAREGR